MMRIYKPGTVGRETVYVTPGNEFKHVKNWVNAEGKPIQFAVEFVNGMAKVEANLGLYMITNKMASKSPIITDLRQAG